MTEVAALVADAWRDGIGPDDGVRLGGLLARDHEPAIAGDPAFAELRLFAAWYDLLSNTRVDVPPAPAGPAARVVHIAAELEASRLSLEPARVEAAIEALDAALAALDGGDPRAPAARAWADLALGELAMTLGDAPTARRRFAGLTDPNCPVALRITAMLRLASAALGCVDVDPAWHWARKAMTVAEHAHRFEHSMRAGLLLGTLECASGDLPAMRKMLHPYANVSMLARLLLATHEAMPLLAEGLRVATEQGDVLLYMLCTLVGARRYIAINHHADALITVSAAIQQLRPLAPHLAGVLEQERATWRESWGSDRFDAS